MLVGIYANIDHNYHNLQLALDLMQAKGVEKCLCLGNLTHSDSIQHIVSHGIPTHFVLNGNVDNRFIITQNLFDKEQPFTVAEQSVEELDLAGHRVALLHHPSLDYSAVYFYSPRDLHFDQVDNCWLISPGGLARKNNNNASFVLWNTETNDMDVVYLETVYAPGP
jgi:predicted phosphodiesterase